MMNTPILFAPRRAAPDTDVIPAYFPAPGLGLVPINAFVIHAREPVLVDGGWGQQRDGFVQHLASIIPLDRLRWLWLTHADQDHVGCIAQLLEKAPKLKVVTTYFGMAKMSLFAPLPMDRVHLLNPGEQLDVGDRSLVCMRPPTFDSPETTALYDTKQRTLFSADSFGGVLDEPFDSAESMSDRALEHGIQLWASADSPWLQYTDPVLWDHTFDAIRDFDPVNILSSHLPPAHDVTDRLIHCLRGARNIPAFVGPNQAAFQQLLQQAAE